MKYFLTKGIYIVPVIIQETKSVTDIIIAEVCDSLADSTDDIVGENRIACNCGLNIDIANKIDIPNNNAIITPMEIIDAFSKISLVITVRT